jgi:hypothetical protein
MKALLLMLLVFGTVAHAQYGTTYIGTENKSGTMYKYTDQNGKTAYSDAPPPASCTSASCVKIRKEIEHKVAAEYCGKNYKRYKWQDDDGKPMCSDSPPPPTCKTSSCNELRRYAWKDEREKAIYSDSLPPLTCTTSSCVAVRKSAEASSRRVVRSNMTHLRKSVIVCAAPSHLESIKMNYNIADALIERGNCYKLSEDVQYQTASRTFDNCGCLQVILTGARGNPVVWVSATNIARELFTADQWVVE